MTNDSPALGGDKAAPFHHIDKWPDQAVSGAKRMNAWIEADDNGKYDTFHVTGKDDSCHASGDWWDMICFARNVLASENTKLAAPEFYMPHLKNDNYTGAAPYSFGELTHQECGGRGCAACDRGFKRDRN